MLSPTLKIVDKLNMKIFGILCILTSFSLDLWGKPREPIKTWKDGKTYYTKMYLDNVKIDQWKDPEEKRLLDVFVKAKQESLRLIDITDYKVSQFIIRNEKRPIEVEIRGSYKDKRKRLVIFHERHLYWKYGGIQMLATSLGSLNFKKSLKEFNKHNEY